MLNTKVIKPELNELIINEAKKFEEEEKLRLKSLNKEISIDFKILGQRRCSMLSDFRTFSKSKSSSDKQKTTPEKQDESDKKVNMFSPESSEKKTSQIKKIEL